MKRLILLTAVWVCVCSSIPAGEAAKQSPPPAVRFGCQARTFGEGVYKDEATFLSVVRQVGEVGFEGIETNWKNLERYFDRPAEFEAILKRARLKLIGAHIGGGPWNAAARAKLLKDVARTAQFVKRMGGSYIVLSGAAPKARPLPPDTWPRMATFVNEVGRVCAAADVRCLYHNHVWECEGDGLETMCRSTDPKLVGFALDTGHALQASKDPAALIKVLGKRLGLVHFADFVQEGGPPGKRPSLGQGRLQIRATVDALRQADFDQWIVLEEDGTSGGGRALAEKGLATFRAAFQAAR